MCSPNPISTPENSVDPAPKSTRRTFTVEYRNRILDEYNNAPHGEKSAVLRREGLYQSQLREWSGARGSKRHSTVQKENIKGRNNTDAADRKEVDCLTRANVRLAKQLTQTEAALASILHKRSLHPNAHPGMTGRPVCSRDTAGFHFSGVVFFPLVPTRFTVI